VSRAAETGSSADEPAEPHHLDPQEIEALREQMVAYTGLAYYGPEREAEFTGRVAMRLKLVGMPSLREYVALLKRADTDPEGAAERAALIDALTITETYFFRFREQFEALRDVVLPRLLEENRPERTLDIWCAGCSNGAEPYTIAILLHRHFAEALSGWRVCILGTDINRHALANAAAAQYLPWSLRGLEAWEREMYFDLAPESRSYTVKPRYREWVRFEPHNLISDAPPLPGRFDLIFCRNVLIYFDTPTTETVLQRFADALRPDGCLFVGHADPVAGPVFRTVFRLERSHGVHLYHHRRRRAGAEADEDATSLTFDEFGGATVAPVEPVAPIFPAPVTAAAWKPPSLSELRFSAPPLALFPIAAPSPAPLPPPLVGVREAAREALDRGAADEALAVLEPALDGPATTRHDPLLHFYQALALEQAGRWDEAEQPLRRALYLDRTFTLAHYHLALQAERSGDLPRAARSLDNAAAALTRATAAGDAAALHLLTEVGGIAADEMAEAIRIRRASLPPQRRGAQGAAVR
jgi:chemotaxis protein methyltransferase CheR